ncbi:hypothetical protein VTL71DRAFT_8563 [Oculimacula yallundae]|uniref:Uncharacterized protein n=1 Tax=Oculimacula yallundae TaxID=86028 RepID=A0ABR4CY07_9HELO
MLKAAEVLLESGSRLRAQLSLVTSSPAFTSRTNFPPRFTGPAPQLKFAKFCQAVSALRQDISKLNIALPPSRCFDSFNIHLCLSLRYLHFVCTCKTKLTSTSKIKVSNDQQFSRVLIG